MAKHRDKEFIYLWEWGGAWCQSLWEYLKTKGSYLRRKEGGGGEKTGT